MGPALEERWAWVNVGGEAALRRAPGRAGLLLRAWMAPLRAGAFSASLKKGPLLGWPAGPELLGHTGLQPYHSGLLLDSPFPHTP